MAKTRAELNAERAALGLPPLTDTPVPAPVTGINAERAALGLPPRPAPTTSPERRPVVQQKLTELKGQAETIRGDLATDKLRQDIALEVTKELPVMTAPDFIRQETERRLKQRVQEVAPPLYMGAFTPVQYGSLVPLARPKEVPVDRAQAPGFMEAMSPQTRVGEAAASRINREQTAGYFDDAEFSKSIADLPDTEKRGRLDFYEAYKAAFKKVKDMNPAVADEDIKADLDRQVKALDEGKVKTFTDNPAARMGLTNDPTIRAFQPQVETATIPMFEPGQLALLQNLDRIKRGRAVASSAADTERELRTKGVEVTKIVKRPTGDTTTGGKPVFEDTQVGTGVFRPATETEIKSAVDKARTSTEKADALPFYLTEDRDKVLSNIEDSAKGGTFFAKEYPTGATVESPVSWFVRSVMTVPNALTGAVSEVFTPPEIGEKERAARPALYKDASAAVYNVAQSRGLMGEVTDLYDFYPNTDLKPYRNYAAAAGFAGDIIGLDLGLIGGAASGLREAYTGYKAAGALSKAAGVAERVVPALERGAAGGAKEFLSTIGLEKTASKIKLGDVRLVYGAQLGDSYRAASTYENVVKSELERGANEFYAHEAGLQAVVDTAPRSKFLKDAENAGPRIIDDLGDDGKYFAGGAGEWKEYRRVNEATDILRTSDDPVALAKAAAIARPYLAPAVRNVKEVGRALDALATQTGRTSIKATEVFKAAENLPVEKQDAFYNAVRDAAAIQNGVTTVDRATSGLLTDPGRFTIRLTPNTFTTSDAVESILTDVRKTAGHGLVKDITSTPLNPTTGLYSLDATQGDGLRRAAMQLAATGSLARPAAMSILKGVTAGAVSPADLRALMYAVEDTVAVASKKGFKSSALAERGFTERPISIKGEQGVVKLPLPGSRAVSFGEDVGFVNSLINRVTSGFTDWWQSPTSLKKILNPDQMRVIEDARRAIGVIPKRLELLMGDAVGDTVAQKLIGLSLRVEPGVTAQAIRNIEFWKDVAKSSIFGANKRSLGEWVLGEFKYNDPFSVLSPAGKDALESLTIKYQKDVAKAGTTLADVERMIPDFIDEARALIAKYPSDVFFEKGGKVFDLKAKPQEILVGTWARKDATAIHEDAIAKLLAYEPDTIGEFGLAFRNRFAGIKGFDGQAMGDVPLSTVVARMMMDSGEGTRTVNTMDDVLALPGIKKWVADIDRMRGETVGEEFLRQHGQFLLDDVAETIGALEARYDGGVGQAIRKTRDLERLYKGGATLGETGGPLGTLLGDAVREELGAQPKFKELLRELGSLAEEEASGKVSAFKARRMVTEVLEATNNAFYAMVLYLNPRFHGINISSAPFIGYSTTGRIPSPSALTAGGSWVKDVVVIDRNGIPYTNAQIYDIVARGGAYKSQAAATIDARFLKEAQGMLEDLEEVTPLRGAVRGAKKLAMIPAKFAEASDNAWRVAYVKDALASGKTMDEALEVGRKSLYDYGAATDFERKYVARQILFYNFFRNNVLQSAKGLLVNPSRFIRQARLTQDVSKMVVGEDKWDDMRFYTPLDAGVSRLVAKFAPQANREGDLLLLPQMPYYDAVYILSGLLSAPTDIVRGVPDPVTGKRDFGSGYVFNKLTPSLQAAAALTTGADMTYDLALKKNVAPVPQLALVDAAAAPARELGGPDLFAAYVKLFDMKKRPAQPGEEGYEGYVYTMTEDNFERYKSFLKGAKLLGATRPITDYGKLVATLGGATGQTASTTVTPTSAVGLTTQTKANIPQALEADAARIRAEQLSREEKERAALSGARRAPEKKR